MFHDFQLNWIYSAHTFLYLIFFDFSSSFFSFDIVYTYFTFVSVSNLCMWGGGGSADSFCLLLHGIEQQHYDIIQF